MTRYVLTGARVGDYVRSGNGHLYQVRLVEDGLVYFGRSAVATLDGNVTYGDGPKHTTCRPATADEVATYRRTESEKQSLANVYANLARCGG